MYDLALGDNAAPLQPRDVLYIAGDRWNWPQWQTPCLLLSILFGKQQLEFSLQRWSGEALSLVQKIRYRAAGARGFIPATGAK